MTIVAADLLSLSLLKPQGNGELMLLLVLVNDLEFLLVLVDRTLPFLPLERSISGLSLVVSLEFRRMLMVTLP